MGNYFMKNLIAGFLLCATLSVNVPAHAENQQENLAELLAKAIYNGQEKVVKNLIKEGIFNTIDINSKIDSHYTPLFLATQCGCHKIVQMFIDAGANLDVRSYAGDTPLHCASLFYRPQLALAELFIKLGANVNIANDYGETPLHRAMRGNRALVRMLIAAKANVNAKDKNRETPLHLAFHDYEKTRMLIDAGADVTIQDNKGNTPLHNAALFAGETVIKDRGLIIQALLLAGAQRDVKNNEGKTPLDLLKEDNDTIRAMLS